MTDRYTRTDAEAAFERLAKALNKPIGHYRAISEEERASGKTFETIPGGWALDANATYGGYVIEEIDGDGGTGIHHPMGERRRSAREFVEAVRFALDSLALKCAA